MSKNSITITGLDLLKAMNLNTVEENIEYSTVINMIRV